MTNELKISRELASRLERQLSATCNVSTLGLLDELRSLLVAPAVERQEPVKWGAPKTVRQLIRQLETLDQDLRPVSILRVPASVFEDGKERSRAVHLSFSYERVEGQWLSAFKGDGEKVVAFWCRMEQPAPVAVVLPERMQWESAITDVSRGTVDGWNACLDKVKEMSQ